MNFSDMYQHFLFETCTGRFKRPALRQLLSNEELPLRAELLHAGQMESFCKSLAHSHETVPGNHIQDLHKRLLDNEKALQEIHRLMTGMEATEAKTVNPLEWKNNFFVIQDQINRVKASIRRVDWYVPRLANEHMDGCPRIYHIITQLIAHSNSQIDIGNMVAFVNAYQAVFSLQIGELKATSDILKLSLIENVRRLAVKFAVSLIEQDCAAGWITKLTSARRGSATALHQAVRNLLQSVPEWKSGFVAALIAGLQSNDRAGAAALECISEQLAAAGLTVEEVLRFVHGEQAADRVSFRNCVSSLRVVDSIDWQVFVDSTSILEPVLRSERSGIYSMMTFYTRHYYRIQTGVIARKTSVSEQEVAQRAVFLANHAPDENGPEAHVGYYLIGPGRRQLVQSLAMQPAKKAMISGFIRKYPLLACLGMFGFITVMAGGVLWVQLLSEDPGVGLLTGMGLMLLWGASHFAKQVTDSVAALFGKVVILPRLDFSKGIPEQFRTLVVVPVIVSSKEDIDEMVHGLEVRFLANRIANLHFALLTDFKDAAQETLPGEDLVLRIMQQKIEALNLKYGSPSNGLFFLFHRPRKWNASEQKWMGYERKRGKLMELNALLRGEANDRFAHITGDQSLFARIKYVISLDADTQLPKDAAWQMVGSIAHPLNRAVYSEKHGRVIAGYGVLQTRMGTDLCDAEHTWYQRLTGMGPDLDPYTRATPDMYQDVFGEGSYVGKGIYDVDIMLKALHNRFPENRILSHDLIEGCYVRSGLLNDLKLYEKTTGYLTDISRRHRWIRGDWQIAAWATPFVPDFNNNRVRNPLSALSRWKIFDNLRTSLLPLIFLALLILAWTVLQDPLFWTVVIALIVLSPALVIFINKLLMHPEKIFSPHIWKTAAVEAGNRFVLNMLELVTLPFDACYTGDAVVRANWRLLISRRKLLEWVPSSSYRNKQFGSGMYFALAAGPALALLLGGYLAAFRPVQFIWSLPLLALWMISPAVIWWLNRRLVERTEILSTVQQNFLRKLARKTWAYFETFINKEVNWLPPDHYRERPAPKLALYTSPTNMGLALMAYLSACDFGYITTGRFLTFCSNTLDAMDRLERYKGHFYNWYNIHTLQPALPRYVSTVDSGNLAGHLLVMRGALNGLPAEKAIGANVLEGIRDTCRLLQSESDSVGWKERLKKLPEPGSHYPDHPGAIKKYTERLSAVISSIITGMPETEDCEVHYWLKALERQCTDILMELRMLAPWLWLPPAPEKFRHLIPKNVPALLAMEAMRLRARSEADALFKAAVDDAEHAWLLAFIDCMNAAAETAEARIACMQQLAQRCTGLADMEYDFLYNPALQLLSIGYQAETGCQDAECYDMLASEARMATYVGICQNKLPAKSWFNLGRTLVNANDSHILLSANGTMFEYLMPALVMPAFENTLLDKGCRAAVQEQIAHGKKYGIPWGVSESAYNVLDKGLNYQYKVFGIPELSFKHVYDKEDRVIAPYASAMALMIDPPEACQNLERLSAEGGEGRYGMYESIDYTASRQRGKRYGSVVYSYMVHHQGMSLLGLAGLLLNKPMQRRFSADAQLHSISMILQERIPVELAVELPGGREHTDAGPAAAATGADGAALHENPISFAGYDLYVEHLLRNDAANGKEPVVLLRTWNTNHTEMVSQVIRMHAYLRMKGQMITLIIWNEDMSCYRRFLQRVILEMITTGPGAEALNRQNGGIFVKSVDNISDGDLALLQTAAWIITEERWYAPAGRALGQKQNKKSTPIE